MVIGITGISGSGKHTVGEYLERKGWFVLDADKLAHKAYRPYTAVWKGIVETFGERVLSNNDLIDRQKLGKIVFNASDPQAADEALTRLNEIVHPYVKRKIVDEIHRKHRRKVDVAVVTALWDAADLLEACDRILLIQADHEVCMERTRKRDGISSETYLMRVRHQSEPDRPDATLRNEGTKEDLWRKVNEAIAGFVI